ncbi:ribonuclease h1 [Apiospora sp. TS-2023a]
MAKKNINFYAVAVGRQPGVYDNWGECEKQVKGFSGAKHKGFATRGEARSYVSRYGGMPRQNDHEQQRQTQFYWAQQRGYTPAAPVYLPPKIEQHDAEGDELATTWVEEKPSERFDAHDENGVDKVYFAVVRGRRPGIYSRERAEEQVDGFPDAYYDVFSTYAEASGFMRTQFKKTEAATAASRPSNNTVIATGAGSAAAGAPRVPYAEKYYAVAVGRVPGIYYNWETCEKQVKKYSGAVHKSFLAYEEAVEFVRERGNHFAMVADFQPNNSAPFEDEFDRFASSQGIAQGSQEYRKQRTTAIAREFDVLYLSQSIKKEEDDDRDDIDDGDDWDIKEEEEEEEPMSRAELLLRAFHAICREVEVAPRSTLRECEMAIKDLGLINIVDFIDAKRYGKKVHIWPWAQFQAFRKYTLGSRDKCMVLDIAKQHDLLRALLQNLTGKKAEGYARMMAMRQSRSNVPSLPRSCEIRTPVPPKSAVLREWATQNPGEATALRTGLQGAITRIEPYLHNTYNVPTPPSPGPAVRAGAAVEPVKEEEDSELPLNSISRDPALPTIICSQKPPINAATSQPSPPGEPSQQPHQQPDRPALPRPRGEEAADRITIPATQQNKRKRATLTEILDDDDSVSATPAAKKLKRGTPSTASVRS